MSFIGQLASSAALGMFGAAEGAAFVLCGIGNPQAFRDQMEFKNFLLMKVFLAGVGSSMLSQSILSMMGVSKMDKTRSYSNMRVPYSRAVPGCLMLGAGMYFAGSGPTMLPSQLCSFVESAPYVFAGMLTGAALFTFIENSLFGTGDQGCPRATKEETSVDGALKQPYWKVAAPMGAAMMGMAGGFEYFFPHSADIERYGLSQLSATVTPILAGVVVGANQVPIRLISPGGQGGSSSVMRILAHGTGGVIGGKYKIQNFGQFCQPIYVYGGTSIGAYLAFTRLAGGQAAPTGYDPLVSYLGGALMLFGARFANGCTCGHGISGMSELAFTSIAGGMSIFAGGIAAGVIKNTMFS